MHCPSRVDLAVGYGNMAAAVGMCGGIDEMAFVCSSDCSFSRLVRCEQAGNEVDEESYGQHLGSIPTR